MVLKSARTTYGSGRGTARRRLWAGAAVFALGIIGVSGLVGALSQAGHGTGAATSAGPAASAGAIQDATLGPPAHGYAVNLNTEKLATTQAAGAAGAEAMRAASVPARGLPSSPPRPSQPAHVGQATAASLGQSALIEQTGAVTVIVPLKRIQTDVNQLTALATASGGFVASTSTQSAGPGFPAEGTVTLQVPVATFGNVLAQVKALGKVASETTSATDVTGQYVDLEAQITALQDSGQQYLTIMTKATTIGGILAVQSQLDQLQSQLDQLQSQLKTLTNETTYSTLVVTLAQTVVTPPPPRPEGGLLRAWHSAANGFVAGWEGVVRVAGPLFFALLLAGVLFVIGRFAWRAAWRASRRSSAAGRPLS